MWSMLSHKSRANPAALFIYLIIFIQVQIISYKNCFSYKVLSIKEYSHHYCLIVATTDKTTLIDNQFLGHIDAKELQYMGKWWQVSIWIKSFTKKILYWKKIFLPSKSKKKQQDWWMSGYTIHKWKILRLRQSWQYRVCFFKNYQKSKSKDHL